MLKLVRKLIYYALIILVGAALVLTLFGYLQYKRSTDEMPLSAMVSETRAKDSFTPLSELPELYVNAVIAAEDRRFRLHFGIDPLGIARALTVNLRDGEFKEGGSTVTQQLAKNYYYLTDRNIVKKAAEAFVALKLERDYSKDEILELYVNTIYFGDGCYCVRDAALHYFGKQPRELNGYECTMLAGIPNAPSVYAPTKNPGLAEQRRKTVVRRLASSEYITDSEAAELLNSADLHEKNY